MDPRNIRSVIHKLERKMFRFIVCLLFLGLPLLTSASFPEYEHLTEDEKAELNSPRLIGSEYESDRLAYQFLSSWHALFLDSQNSFQYTAGSLGPTRFYTRGRLRLAKELSESFKFQISWVDIGDARTNRQALIFEFYLKVNSWLLVSLYGEPSTLKKQDDIGVSTTFLTSNKSQLRFFYTWTDFSYNKRNEKTDRYTVKPGSLGSVWRWSDQESFIQTSFRKDLNSRQVFDSGRVYQQGSTQAQWLSRHSLSEAGPYYLQTEFNFSKSNETDTLNTDNGIESWQNETWDGLVQIEQNHRFVSLYGIRVLHSHWASSQGDVIHNNILPHLWTTAWQRQIHGSRHTVDLGYEFTWHRGQGPVNLRSTLDAKDKLEHRMNLRYRIKTFEETFFNLLLTFDLDEFGGGETWEGGAMQFSTRF